MVLIIHISIAVLSLIAAGLNIATPTTKTITITTGSTIVTLMSGVMLVLQGSSLWHFCMSGVLLLGIATVTSVVAFRRLKHAQV